MKYLDLRYSCSIERPMTATAQPISGELFRPDHEAEDHSRLLDLAREQSRVEQVLSEMQEQVLAQRRARADARLWTGQEI